MIAALTKRHMQVFFRDKGAVFFSLLSPLIVFLLFFLFLGASQLESIKESLPHIDEDKLSIFLNSWVYAGIVMVTTITTGLAALGVFVADRESGRFTDFAVSPVSRWKVVVSYLLATVSIAAIITTIVYIVAQTYLIIQGAPVPTLGVVVQTIGLYLLTAFSFGALSSLVVTFIKSSAAFTSLSVIVGTGAGFVAGIYVPIGIMSAGIANVLNSLPFAQAAALLREPFVAAPLEAIGEGQPVEVVKGLTETYGLQVVIDGHILASSTLIVILVALGVVALILATVQISRKLK
ncbi:ABC transporter permease [Candidatus Saccharibacteria bacterium]|nr:ABC transporter permease [Candidatus Saccharibacteria bacterium]